jgi:hypothetical protein
MPPRGCLNVFLWTLLGVVLLMLIVMLATYQPT